MAWSKIGSLHIFKMNSCRYTRHVSECTKNQLTLRLDFRGHPRSKVIFSNNVLLHIVDQLFHRTYSTVHDPAGVAKILITIPIKHNVSYHMASAFKITIEIAVLQMPFNLGYERFIEVVHCNYYLLKLYHPKFWLVLFDLLYFIITQSWF